MILELDLHLLYKSSLTPNQFVFCNLLNNKHYLVLQKLIKTTKFIDKSNIVDLLSKEYISSETYFSLDNFDSTIRFLKVTDKFKELLPETLSDPFDDILNLYPTKVTRPNGNIDYLRVAIKKCKTLYNNMIKKSASKHELIVKALKYELEVRKKENTIRFMKRLPKWLEEEEWQVYYQRMEDDIGNNNISINNYGGELL